VKVKVLPGGAPYDVVRVGEDLLVPKLTIVKARGEPHKGDPALDIEIDVVPDSGRLVAQEVRVRRQSDGVAVTGEALRGVPVAGLTKWAARHVKRVISIAPDGTTTAEPAGVPEDQVVYVREHGLTEKTIEIVAHTYRMALLMGNPPTKMIEEWLEVPRSTAGRWIATARERGLLGKAEGPGKAGG
jgi:hypothetical protein